MITLQILVAAMHQTDFSLVEKMNLQCDAILANQTVILVRNPDIRSGMYR